MQVKFSATNLITGTLVAFVIGAILQWMGCGNWSFLVGGMIGGLEFPIFHVEKKEEKP